MCLVTDDPTLLHKNCYVMIKYAQNGRSRPLEKVFKIDNQDLVLLMMVTDQICIYECR